MKQLTLIVLILLSLTIVSASITCNQTYIMTSYNQSQTNVKANIYCNNPDNATTISTSGSYISTTETAFSSGSKTIPIDFSSSAPIGFYSGSLNFGSGESIPIFLNVLSAQNNNPTTSISFPTSKTINVQQGAEYQKKVTMIIPSSYPNPIEIKAIEFSEDTEILHFGDIETGVINPGDIKDIPLVINARNAQQGQYPPITVQVRYDDSGEIKTLNCILYIIVTANLNPTTNQTFSTPPSCSLSANTMNLNETYSFTCSGVSSNLAVTPLYNEYFVGQGVQLSSGIYTYEFRPTKYGNTDFIATFTYLSAPIFNPFKQSVKIASSSSQVGGTELSFKFTPLLKDASANQEIIVQLIDNKTGNLVDNPKVYLDAIQLSNVNGSEKSFPITMQVGKDYELRGEASAYNNIIQIINITKKPISVSNLLSVYKVNDVLDLNITPENCSFLLNNNVITLPYTFTTSGDKTLKIVKEGYLDYSTNFTVSSLITAQCTPITDDWKKGKKIICDLSNSTSWKVLKDGVTQEEGSSKVVEFKIDDYGSWEIREGDNYITGKYLEKPSKAWYHFTFWDFKKWYDWALAIFVGLIILLIIYRVKKSKEYKEEPISEIGGE